MLNLRFVVGLGSICGLAFFAGCGKEQPRTPSAAPLSREKEAENHKPDIAVAEKPAAAEQPSELPEGLKDLGPEDLAAVQKQKVCPVTGEELGSMGKPYKVIVKGRTVFLCCSGCEEELKKNPDKFLAKLKK